MLTQHGHLTYCTNIHAGESWADHFKAISENLPLIKKTISKDHPMGVGLRLSNTASAALIQREQLNHFKHWLKENDLYVFTLNGFPYGGFHRTRVKDQVHAPDWTTRDRVEYTKRLFSILKELLPEGMDGGQSTSPLSYRHWFSSLELFDQAKTDATKQITEIVLFLANIYKEEGKILHLDIEPEPDGLLETGEEFIDWYNNVLLPGSLTVISKELNVNANTAADIVKRHICLCYDVCHFAIGYEPHQQIINRLNESGIRVGKIQISAALKGMFGKNDADRKKVIEAFAKFNEPTYLHQVVAKTDEGKLFRYRDLPEALAETLHNGVCEWRAHFHVPIAEKQLGLLESTQDAISEVLQIQKQHPFTNHLEVETYTWEVLPPELKMPLADSITREMNWVIHCLDN